MSERKARIALQHRNGAPVFVFDGAHGEFAEFPTLDKLEKYLKAMDVVAEWRSAPEDCPQSENIVLPPPRAEAQETQP